MRDTFVTDATVADLQRRLDIIEAIYFGGKHEVPHHSLLVSLYWDACKQDRFDDATTARHWERQIYALDARALLLLARTIRDPLPWHPMLVVLDRFTSAGFDVEACRQHLLGAARDLLTLQGFRKINPRDIMGNPLRVKSILAAISNRGGPDAQRETGSRQDPGDHP